MKESMSWVGLLVCGVVLMVGCGPDEPKVDVKVRQLGHMMEVELGSGPLVEFEVMGRKLTRSSPVEPWRAYVPVSQLGVGAQKIPYKVMDFGSSWDKTLDVQVEDPGQGAFVQVVRCAEPELGGARLTKGGEHLDKGCAIKDGKVGLELMSVPGATLRFDGLEATVGDDGRALVQLEIYAGVGRLSVDALVMEGEKRDKLDALHEVVVEVEGQRASLEVGYQVDHVDRQQDAFAKELLKVKEGKAPSFVSQERDDRQVMVMGPSGFNRFGWDGPAQSVDLVAVAQVTKRRKKRSCGTYMMREAGLYAEDETGLEMRELEQFDVDWEVVVYDATNAQEIGRKAFRGGKYNCPKSLEQLDRVGYLRLSDDRRAVENGPDDDDVKAWLRTLMKKKEG